MAKGTSATNTGVAIRRNVVLHVDGLTMMAWVRVAGTPPAGETSVFGIHDLIHFMLDSTSLLALLYTENDNTTVWDIATAPTSSQYHHLAFTCSGPEGGGAGVRALVGYYDGAVRSVHRVGNDTAILDNIVAGNVMAMGGNVLFSAPVFCQHSRFWTRVLTAGEIRREMTSRFAVSRQGLFADLPLIHDNTDLVQGAVWEENETPTTEAGPVLGGPVAPAPRLAQLSGGGVVQSLFTGGALPWSSVNRPARA